MDRLFRIRPVWAVVFYVILDTICVGMGMGVPIFCILFGFVVGWTIARAAIARTERVEEIVRSFLPQAAVTAALTFVWMVVIWGGATVLLFDPNADYVEFGIPMILFDPKASFIGWQVLMIFISPFLQVLSTLFGSHITLIWWMKKRVG